MVGQIFAIPIASHPRGPEPLTVRVSHIPIEEGMYEGNHGHEEPDGGSLYPCPGPSAARTERPRDHYRDGGRQVGRSDSWRGGYSHQCRHRRRDQDGHHGRRFVSHPLRPAWTLPGHRRHDRLQDRGSGERPGWDHADGHRKLRVGGWRPAGRNYRFQFCRYP